jgi:elongation factor G
MKTYEPQDIRNIGLIGHKASGKTSVAEAALWSAKVSNRLGRTADGTSTLDYEDEEHKRVMSIQTTVASLEWGKNKVNVIDTPGDGNFLADTRLGIQAMDGAICVISAKDGVEPMTERVWAWATMAGLDRAIFVSKMDIENADFARTLADIKEHLCKEATALQMPIGQGHEFRGIVDLLAEKAYLFEDGDEGLVKETAIPEDVREAAEDARNALIEDIATVDESLMEKYFEGALTEAEIRAGLAAAMHAGTIIPVLCGSGTTNRGVRQLLDFAVEELPAPTECEPREGTLGEDAATRAPTADGPFAAVVFKTIVDQHAGRINILRVLSGTAESNLELKNTARHGTERLGTLNRIAGKKLEAVDKATVGDIFAVAKLKETHTGDTLSTDGWVAKTPELPAPLISRAITAGEKSGEDKIAAALKRILEEDPGLQVVRDERTGEQLLCGTGQQHVEVAIERLKRKFGVSCELHLPRIPYNETISASVTGVEGKHKKQTGGSGQFGVCYFDLEPGPRGSGFEFVDNVVGGAIPRQFIPSVEKGMHKAMSRGLVAGYPIVDLRIRLYDGKYHAVDSSDVAFQIAASKGLRAAFQKAKPILLEPIVQMDITVPDDNMGDVMGDVNTRRGRVMGSETTGKYCTVKAQMPLAEVQTYEATLRAMTQGRGSFTMEHSHMDVVPAHIQEKIVKDSGFVAHDDDE